MARNTEHAQTQKEHELKTLRILSSALGFAASAMVVAGAMLLLSPNARTVRFGLVVAGSGFGMGFACLVVAITGIAYARRR
jgi:hypothetical protein